MHTIYTNLCLFLQSRHDFPWRKQFTHKGFTWHYLRENSQYLISITIIISNKLWNLLYIKMDYLNITIQTKISPVDKTVCEYCQSPNLSGGFLVRSDLRGSICWLVILSVVEFVVVFVFPHAFLAVESLNIFCVSGVLFLVVLLVKFPLLLLLLSIIFLIFDVYRSYAVESHTSQRLPRCHLCRIRFLTLTQ